MTHFEDFDRRKAEADEERRLRDALYALNSALEPDGEGEPFDRLRRVRDEVWSLGADLYGWTD